MLEQTLILMRKITFLEESELKDLNICLKGDALNLANSFNHSDLLHNALMALENANFKPEFVIGEIYKNLKSLPPVSSFQNVKIIKAQEQTIK